MSPTLPQNLLKRVFILLTAVVTGSNSLSADEGMFLISRPDRFPTKQMQRAGCNLSPEQIYSSDNKSLKDAVVMFDNGCTGVVVSSHGLVLTNHHCGYESIQSVSNTKENYLRDGFAAQTRKQEIPVDGLTINFLRRVVNLTDSIVPHIKSCTSDFSRTIKADSIGNELIKREYNDERYLVEILPFYEGTEYYLMEYEVFRDIRLVLSPPSYIGKFGGETDNWVWPRHSGDFSFFRIYTAPDGSAAEYSPDNIPMKSKKTIVPSLEGYRPGSFAMTIGFPGSTSRNSTSWSIDHLNRGENEIRVLFRTLKQRIWAEAMRKSEAIQLMYASKYAASANYHKYSIGQQEQLERNGIAKEREQQQALFAQWAEQTADTCYRSVLSNLELGYKEHMEGFRALNGFQESYLTSSDVVQLIIALMAVDTSSEEGKKAVNDAIKKEYASISLPLDQAVLKETIQLFSQEVAQQYHPETVEIDKLYRTSLFAQPKKLARVVKKKGIEALQNDPFWEFAFEVQMKFYEIIQQMGDAEDRINHARRLYLEGIMQIHSDSSFYPDANFTMRMSYGTVAPLADSSIITTSDQLLKRTKPNDPEFEIGDSFAQLLKKREFGRYATPEGSLAVNLISNNDITGGNSGSPLINSDGQLIGLAFDGNWDGMAGDIRFNSLTQRTISVDIRYILFIVERLMLSPQLIDEMGL